MLNTPVLLLIFNRPDTTSKVFEAIRMAKPKQLFIAADGPRINKKEDIEKCEAVRKIAINVDWDCEVKTLFRNENLGCGQAPAQAITWFFEHVEQGIILEDDILPSNSFFKFCEILLEKYKEDTTIMSIGGSNFLYPNFTINESYFFSQYSVNWGWASWRRAWKEFDYNITSWTNDKNKQTIKNIFLPEQFAFLESIFNTVCNKNVPDIWDYQWLYQVVVTQGKCIVPAVNLTKNIGFDDNATHTYTISNEIKNASLNEIHFPLVHPVTQHVNQTYDRKLSKKYYWKALSPASISRKIINKIKALINK